MSLLVVGSVAFDSVKTSGGTADEVLGGSATYCAYAASFFGPTRIVSPVGEDMSETHLEELREHNIDVTGVRVVPGGKTLRWSGRYSDSFLERTTEDIQLNVFADYDTTLPDEYLDSEYVFLANGAPEAQRAVLEQLPDRKLAFLDTMNHWIEGSRGALDEVLGLVDGLVVNDEEARLLTGETNLLTAARRLAGFGPEIVVIKKGEHGAILVADGKPFALHAWMTEDVRDPTGAGDCFGGALMGTIAGRHDRSLATIRAGIVYGTVLASFCIEGFSLDGLRRVTMDDVERRREELLGMIRWHE
ncbi:MAG: PfkB family carbohydrate kinase [Planctomycetota bacterium]